MPQRITFHSVTQNSPFLHHIYHGGMVKLSGPVWLAGHTQNKTLYRNYQSKHTKYKYVNKSYGVHS